MTADVVDRMRIMGAILERAATSNEPEMLEEIKLLLRDADLEIVNLRLRLRHAYDRENASREIIGMMPTPPAPRRWWGWRWQR